MLTTFNKFYRQRTYLHIDYTKFIVKFQNFPKIQEYVRLKELKVCM